MSNAHEEKKVNKIVPSKLEHALYHILYKYVGDRIPANVTPNQITLIGAIGSLLGIICGFLARFHLLFLIGTLFGLTCHLICDDLDGYIARKRNMTSLAGGYFDLLTDILHITYLIIALAFSHVICFPVAIFMAPVYALIIFTAMNDIHYLNTFTFPRLGPIETHLFFACLCIVAMIFGTAPVVTLGTISLCIADLICILGGIPMYYEMIRLQISLYRKLQEKDHDGK